MNFSSSCDAWPDTCTGDVRSCTTSAPARCIESMTRDTFDSLPGIACALMTTTSSGDTFTYLCSCAAISDSALIGSPCEPVQMMHTSPGGVPRRLLDVDDRVRGDVDEAALARHRHVLHHRPPDERDLAPVRDRGLRDLLHPVQVRREARDDEPLVGMLAEQRAHGRADRRLRRREARPFRVRGVGEQQADATVAARDLAEQREVGAPAVDRREVELEVAGVDDRALGREERDREPVRHRVRDRDELAVDRPDAPPFAVDAPR